jgi:hypothetical protein
MANRTGSADLPLHSGYVPPWLVTRGERAKSPQYDGQTV